MSKRPTIASLTTELEQSQKAYQDLYKIYASRERELFVTKGQLEQMKYVRDIWYNKCKYAEHVQSELHGEVLGMNSVLDRFCPRPIEDSTETTTTSRVRPNTAECLKQTGPNWRGPMSGSTRSL